MYDYVMIITIEVHISCYIPHNKPSYYKSHRPTWSVGSRSVASQDEVGAGLLDVLADLTPETDPKRIKVDFIS